MTTLAASPKSAPPGVIAAILGISALASLFLFWLVYYHPPIDAADAHFAYLPALNAILNGSAAVALVIGFVHIRAGHVRAHLLSMSAAFIFSSVFLVTYIMNHALHGDMHFHGQGFSRDVYFPLLISHVSLSVIALPMILITFFLSLSGRFTAHRRLARYTFPIWLYVSVTGVIVYAMLAAFR